MFGYHVAFLAPAFLLLLLGLPLVWWLSFSGLAGLGRWRRICVLAVRTFVLLCIVLALAEMQLVRTSHKLTVLYLVDQSASIPEADRRAKIDYINAEVKRHRHRDVGDRAGLIVFGSDAAFEHPPFDGDINVAYSTETHIDSDRTNIAAALRLAMASFPADSARRVVLVTDGNENLGSALAQARSMTQSGVGIDIVPVRYAARADVAVERISIPPDVNSGQPFDIRVVLNNTAAADASGARARGRLQITRKSGDTETVLSNEPVALESGKHVFNLREEIRTPDFYTYEARYIPDDPSQDAVAADNRATTFTHVRGQGQVLLIENAENRGEFDRLVSGLRDSNLHVVVQSTNELFTSLAELQPFDAVILANVPREAFSAAQIEMLARNTQQLGSGLIMLGGPNSFGAGGWTNTAVEEAMPVDFQIKNAKIRPAGALALVIDRSGSMTGEKLAMAKAAATASVDMLAPEDYASVVAFDTTPYLFVPLVKKESSQSINSQIDRIAADGGTNMYPAMEMAYQQLAKAADASLRHMVILTDGMTEGTGYVELVKRMRESQKVTVSTVGVGPDADVNLLQDIAKAGGGRFYQANSPKSLPKIFQQEARVVARPLVFEHEPAFQPQIAFPHEMVKGVGSSLPPITGYVLTNKKQSPLVEVAAVSPIGPEASTIDNRTILAGWTYGLGKAAVLTTDAGQRWATRWNDWPEYDKLFSQLVRWSMRPVGEQGKFTVTTELANNQVQITATALDRHDNFLNFLDITGSVVGPDMKPIKLSMRQASPGRYVGAFNAPVPGSYFLMLNPGAGMAPILSGVNMPYSPEYLDREANEGLIASLAALVPKGARDPGITIADGHGQGTSGLLEFDTFRHNLLPAISSQDVWYLLLLAAACLLFFDVLLRRVRMSFAWIRALGRAVRHRIVAPEPNERQSETIRRLRGTKSAVSNNLATLQASARFESELHSTTADSGEAGTATINESERTADISDVTALQDRSLDQDETYTGRLLRAKKLVRDQQN